jgi:hypothetical protein
MLPVQLFVRFLFGVNILKNFHHDNARPGFPLPTWQKATTVTV